MIFLRPWLLLLIFLPIVFVFIRAKTQKGGAWKNEVDSHLLPHLIHSFDITKKKKTGGFLFFLWLVACVCLSGPAFEKKQVVAFKQSSGLVVVLDMSPDMNDAELFKAKRKIYDLLDLSENKEIGLVFFDEKAYNVLPLTMDKKIFNNLLETVDTTVMPSKGKNISAGIKKAENMLSSAGFNQGQILLITTGEVKDADFNDSKNYDLSVLNVGNIGQQKISKVPFSYATLDDSDLIYLLADPKKQTRQISDTVLSYQDVGIYGLFFLLPFVLLFYKSGFVFVLFLMFSSPSFAGLWKRTEQEIYEIQKAGIDAYRKADYQTAIDIFSGQKQDTEMLYNLANAYAFSGDIPKAISTYEEVLSRNPYHENAQFNLEYLKKQNPPQSQQDAQQASSDSQQNQQEQKDKQEQQKDTSSESQKNNEQDESSENQSNQSDEQSEQKSQSKQDNQENAQENQDKKEDAQPMDEESSDNLEKEKKENDGKSSKEEKFSAQKQQQEEWFNRIQSDPSKLLRYRLLRQYEAQQ